MLCWLGGRLKTQCLRQDMSSVGCSRSHREDSEELTFCSDAWAALRPVRGTTAGIYDACLAFTLSCLAFECRTRWNLNCSLAHLPLDIF